MRPPDRAVGRVARGLGRAPRVRQRGAALLTAMVIVTLVATLAGAMLWQQWRAVQVEAAERSRTQSQWILDGAIDWARLILREDARGSRGGGKVDHLGEPWALPLAEAKLSTFLAADRDNTDDAPDAFLSGAITDAQARYNLQNLIQGKPEALAAQEQVLQRLFDVVGAPAGGATALALALRAAAPAGNNSTDQAGGDKPKSQADEEGAALMPERLEQLSWLGVDAATIRSLSPFVVLLPIATPVNINTAPKEVLAAVLNIDLASADRMVQERQRQPYDQQHPPTDLPQGKDAPPAGSYGYNSSFFFVRGRLRLQDRVVEEGALVQREGNSTVTVVRRERLNSLESPGS